MKRLLILLCWCTTTSYAQTNFATIHGRVTTLPLGTKVYAKWHDAEHMTMDFLDSTENTADGFTFRIPVEEGRGSQLIFVYGKKIGLHLYVDQGEISFTCEDSALRYTNISGSLFAQELNEFRHLLYSVPKIDSIRKAISLQWIEMHPNSPISVYIMYSNREPLYRKLQPEEQQAILDKLTPAARHNSLTAYLQQEIDKEMVTGIGRMAPGFTQNNTLGKPVSLKSFRGKYVLIDFWASWCGPCRAENPNLVNAFQTYKAKGFTILGVSLDQPNGKSAWLKAIQKDQLTWTNVSDLQYWNNAAAKLYKVQSVPANYLIGPDGIIMARDLRGEELNKKLAEIFKR